MEQLAAVQHTLLQLTADTCDLKTMVVWTEISKCDEETTHEEMRVTDRKKAYWRQRGTTPMTSGLLKPLKLWWILVKVWARTRLLQMKYPVLTEMVCLLYSWIADQDAELWQTTYSPHVTATPNFVCIWDLVQCSYIFVQVSLARASRITILTRT